MSKEIKFADKVTVIGTEKSKYLVTGREYVVHPIMAEKLVKNGAATIKK